MASFLHVLGHINATQGSFYRHTWDFFFRTYAVSLFIAQIMKVACIVNPNASSLISSVRMAGGCLKLKVFFNLRQAEDFFKDCAWQNSACNKIAWNHKSVTVLRWQKHE